MGTQLPLPKRGTVPQFSANVRCGQTTGWTKIALGMEVGLGPGDCVRWGPSYPGTMPGTEGTPTTTQFWTMFIVAKRMDEDATWYGGRPRHRPHCSRRGPSSARNGHSSPPPIFSAHVYCGHGHPSQLLLSSCTNGRPKIDCTRNHNPVEFTGYINFYTMQVCYNCLQIYYLSTFNTVERIWFLFPVLVVNLWLYLL